MRSKVILIFFVLISLLCTDKVNAQDDKAEQCAVVLTHIRSENGPFINNLLNAIGSNDVDAVEKLVSEDPRSVNVRARWGRDKWSILEYAVGVAKLEVVEALIEHGNVDDEIMQEALDHAAEFNKVDAIRLLVRKGADVNKIVHVYHTPLGIAARYNNTDAAKVLLELGAEVDKVQTDYGSHAASDHGVTPLMYAAEYNNVELIEIFIAEGADVNAVNFASGWTPLMYAARNGSVEAIEALFILGDNLDIEARDKRRGWTALIHAIKKASHQAVVALLDIGADIEGADSKKDMTPLMHVVSSRFYPNTIRVEKEVRKIYMTLIDRGADIHATTGFRESVLDLARPGFLGDLTNLIKDQPNNR